MEVVDNTIKYRDFNIEVSAVDDYYMYSSTAKLEVSADGYINGNYYYSDDKTVDTIEKAIKWVDKNYDEHIQKYPIKNS